MTMGLGGVHKKWWREFEQAGGLELADVLAVHPGCHPRAPEFWKGWFGWVFRGQMWLVFDAIERRGLLNQKEVWITEAYAPSSPSYTQLDLRTAADYLVRTYVISIALGVRVIEWYQFQDGVWHWRCPRPTDGEFNFGMLYTDLTPKPQYVAYGLMTEQLEGSTCEGRLDLSADDLYGFRFRRPGSSHVDVLWSYRENHECDLAWWPKEKFKGKHRLPGEPWQERWKRPVEVKLPASGDRVDVTDLMGRATRTASEGGRVSLRPSGSPVYVTGLGAIPMLPRVWEACEKPAAG